jgi:hypothetical protein
MPKKVKEKAMVRRVTYACEGCGQEFKTEEEADACKQVDKMPRVGTERWNEGVRRVACDNLRIGACVDCGMPVAAGMKCSFCGSSNPQGLMSEEDWLEEFEDWGG